MTTAVKLGTQAIGAAGELLVQYQLLKLGIDSARLTTDSGIDLVMYVPSHQSAATIQVKANVAPKPPAAKASCCSAGHSPTTRPRSGWPASTCPPTVCGCYRSELARQLAQQKHADGTRLLYFYTDESIGPKALRLSDMTGHRLETVITALLDGTMRELP